MQRGMYEKGNLMIEILDGIREIANFKEGMHLCLYDNDNVDDYPPHWHAPFEIIMPIENTYRAVCDNVEYMIYPDQILLINSGVIHSLFAPPSGRRLIFQADYTLLHQTRDISNVLATLPSTMLITPESNETAHQQIRMLLLQIRDEYALGNSMFEAAIHAKLIEIFVWLGREQSLCLKSSGTGNNTYKKYMEKFLGICDYISEHCTENITLEEAAKRAGFSKYHFSRLFKYFTNVSFYKYVNRKRISYAENLLINPELTVTEVSSLSGFDSLSSFIRMFKIIKGCTPTDFRSMHKL